MNGTISTSKSLNTEALEKAYLLFDTGLSNTQIASVLGISKAWVSRVRATLSLAKDGDIDGLLSRHEQGLVRWAAKKYNLDLTPKQKPEPPKAEPKAPAAPDNSAQVALALITKLDAISGQLKMLETISGQLSKVLAALEANGANCQKTQQAVYGIATTIHNEAADLKKVLNANTDVITKDLVTCRDHLAMVRSYTKK